MLCDFCFYQVSSWQKLLAVGVVSGAFSKRPAAASNSVSPDNPDEKREPPDELIPASSSTAMGDPNWNNGVQIIESLSPTPPPPPGNDLVAGRKERFTKVNFTFSRKGPWNTDDRSANDDVRGIIGLECKDIPVVPVAAAAASELQLPPPPSQRSSVLLDMGKVVGVLRTTNSDAIQAAIVSCSEESEEDDDEEEECFGPQVPISSRSVSAEPATVNSAGPGPPQHYPSIPIVDESGCVTCGGGGGRGSTTARLQVVTQKSPSENLTS